MKSFDIFGIVHDSVVQVREFARHLRTIAGELSSHAVQA